MFFDPVHGKSQSKSGVIGGPRPWGSFASIGMGVRLMPYFSTALSARCRLEGSGTGSGIAATTFAVPGPEPAGPKSPTGPEG